MPKNHLSENEMDALVKTIHQTEECTSGEIRIHIDTEEAAIPAQKAMNIFHELGTVSYTHLTLPTSDLV